MRQTRAFSNRVDLGSLLPHGELTSTTFCLARPGDEYLVFQPVDGSFTLDLSGSPGQFTTEWSDAEAGDPITSERITSGGVCTFMPPFKAPVILHLKLKQP
jgi:hypothetical protein